MDPTPDERLAAFLRGLAELPPFIGVTYRGSLPENTFRRRAQVVVTQGITATSIDPRIATENGATREVYCIASRGGRDIAPFSAVPSDREVVFPPSTVFGLADSVEIETLLVHLVIELDPTDLGAKVTPEEVDVLARSAAMHLAAVRAAGPVTITTPGKFVGDIR